MRITYKDEIPAQNKLLPVFFFLSLCDDEHINKRKEKEVKEGMRKIEKNYENEEEKDPENRKEN